MVSDWLAVAVGGALGAMLRFWVSESMPSESFPYGTMTVNLVGSVLLGVLTAAVAVNTLSETQALLFGTGLLGAFTTMSTFSIETATLWDEQRWSALLCYVSVTALGGPLLALLSWKTTASVMA
ncbi:MAG: fluoride efflux transporter CrcB [Euryarchaeota archaeon]|jgi:CrcB protein|nr:fluoride efflux transporter CrcB [Euryarchaeota archaeon]MBQ70157.1 fluoride efflux transporter CrcB [Euryarchaeota archaeon]|tara:strand:+ start:1810 stop:2181 length:372 start_codon:yes stop_codon:yes gene_type:complete